MGLRHKKRPMENHRPLVDGGTQTIQFGSRNLQTGSNSFDSAVTPHSETGICNLHKDSRYQRFRVNTSGEFTHAQGVEVFSDAAGFR